MRRLLLSSAVLFLWLTFVFFSCSNGNGTKNKDAQNSPDTLLKANHGHGDSVNAGRSNTVSSGRDTTLQYQQAIKNDAANQARVDSIKRELTKKKK